MRKAYQTDLSDAEWSCLEPHLPAPKATGRPRMHTTREILNAIFYVVRGGCAWRLLPNDFPPWKTVYHYFRFWRLDGTWERMHSALRKTRAGPPEEEPSAQRRDSGFPVGQDDRGGRRRARLRRGQEGEGQEAPSAGGHAGIGARSAGSTAPTSRIATASSSCSNPARDRLASRASPTCGWTPATPARGQGRRLGCEKVLGWTAEIG